MDRPPDTTTKRRTIDVAYGVYTREKEK